LSFSTETEIYLSADGQVIVADLPMELADLMLMLGEVQPCEILYTATARASEEDGRR
jgi:hypothetical protein